MVSASDAFSSTNRGSQGKDDDLGDFFDKLDLQEEEFEDVVVEEEAPELLNEIRWIALARVQTTKTFSQAAFYKDMRAAWNCSRAVRFRPIGPNLFVIQVYCLGDWDRIMDQGPWLFRNMAVLLTQYDGFTKAEEVPILYMPIWLQIHKLPYGYCRHELIVKLLRSAGEVLETRINGNSRGDYVRVRVRHDIRRPLTRFVSIVKGKNRSVYAVRYEKLARFCSVCGIIGHEHKECGNGVFEEKDLKFGDYLYAEPPGRVRQDWEGNRSGKKSNADLSTPKPAARKAEGLGDGELKDTASSPHKPSQPIDMDLDKTSRKRLNMEEGVVTPQEEGLSIPAGGRLLSTDGKETGEATPPSNSSGGKRAKLAGEKSTSKNLSAGSQAERRQSQ
ncbi:hypothetical protein ZWY2020_053791 [Hordeum vulgare]|nr:hypothetical protein ZWY2020_053791 [Hordeum vulgare]